MFSRRQARENMQLTPSEGNEGKHIFAAYARETMLFNAGKHVIDAKCVAIVAKRGKLRLILVCDQNSSLALIGKRKLGNF